MMSLMRFALLLVVLIGVDFSCPLLPGAVAFEVEESVEGRQRLWRDADHAPRAGGPATGPDRVTLTAPRARVRKPPPVARPARDAHRGRSSTLLSSESSLSLLEDH